MSTRHIELDTLFTEQALQFVDEVLCGNFHSRKLQNPLWPASKVFIQRWSIGLVLKFDKKHLSTPWWHWIELQSESVREPDKPCDNVHTRIRLFTCSEPDHCLGILFSRKFEENPRLGLTSDPAFLRTDEPNGFYQNHSTDIPPRLLVPVATLYTIVSL